jgi:hypothetical protein
LTRLAIVIYLVKLNLTVLVETTFLLQGHLREAFDGSDEVAENAKLNDEPM